MLIDGTTFSEVFLNLSGDPRLNRHQQSAAYRIGAWQADQEEFARQFRAAEDACDEAAMRELDELGAIHLAARPFRFGPPIAGGRVFLCEGNEFHVYHAYANDTMEVRLDGSAPRPPEVARPRRRSEKSP
jgi:hypothetical protein